ncbi:hypothetical protein ACPOL_5856 [Acidisarcina polymorpha]|uniref:Uncharacterized protein n=1 Tax=Acidisarcina polymorpha TaxID=2211140 RepID=A0A2Z5G7Z9_9BACT|nr:hypothetical protein ACPOL_5856 [Acidisarcina polymorpha]
MPRVRVYDSNTASRYAHLGAFPLFARLASMRKKRPNRPLSRARMLYRTVIQSALLRIDDNLQRLSS